MEAYVLRWLGGSKYCVSLASTGAILSVECANLNEGLKDANPFCPVGVTVHLGEYQLQRGYFSGCCIVAPHVSTKAPKTTIYRKILL